MEIKVFSIAVLIGLLPAIVAHMKGRLFLLWWVYGVTLFIIALPHALIMRANNGNVKFDELA